MKQYRLPWVRNLRRSSTLPEAPPLYFGPVSNGEVFRTASPRAALVERLIMEKAAQGARRLGLERREFLASSMGMATSLWALNIVTGCADEDGHVRSGGDAGGSVPAAGDGAAMPPGMARGGQDGAAMPPDAADGGYFDVPQDPTDPEQVCESMLDASKEFIFDIQTHHVHRANTLYDSFLRDQLRYRQVCGPSGVGATACFDQNDYVRLMFLESDTTIAVLSGLPAVDDANNPITNAEIAQTRDILNMLADGSERLINHHMVLPNQQGVSADAVQRQLEAMARTKDMFGKVGAWKCYPAWSPNNTEQRAVDGYYFDDPATGLRVVQRGLELGVGTFCIHKGLPIPGFSTAHNDPADIGRVAKLFPQAKFIVYHSGYGNQNSYGEGPYVEDSRNGVDSLISALRASGLGPGSNVYAELGTTWQLATTLPLVGGLTAAAHVIGKLLKYVGVDNVVWGTDSIWYGSPQSQIESFLQFQISEQLQGQYGYPALTMEIKRKILGLNAARAYGIDEKAVRCAVEASELSARRRTLDAELGGRRFVLETPRLTSRREFWRLLRSKNLRPG